MCSPKADLPVCEKPKVYYILTVHCSGRSRLFLCSLMSNAVPVFVFIMFCQISIDYLAG
jgi:hypothetical protein